MKIVMHDIPRMTIEEFAEKHDLTMEVHERDRATGAPDRYYAEFQKAEIKEGCILIGEFGNGSTPEEAIQEYAKRISSKRLVLNAHLGNRRELIVPRLTN